MKCFVPLLRGQCSSSPKKETRLLMRFSLLLEIDLISLARIGYEPAKKPSLLNLILLQQYNLFFFVTKKNLPELEGS
jgi:hypothetical protein